MQSCNHRPVPHEHVTIILFIRSIFLIILIITIRPPNSPFSPIVGILRHIYIYINIHENCSPNYPMRITITGKEEGENSVEKSAN